MLSSLTRGVLAGAAGTAALNLVTYGDMLLRGRSSSSVPADVAGRLADRAGVELGDEQHRPQREQAAGALLGYVTGLGVGAAYGLLNGAARRLPLRYAGPLLGAAAMAGSDIPAEVLRATDASEWSGADWLSDIVPHLAYGFITAAAFGKR